MKHKFLNYLTENDIRVLIFDKDGTLTDTSTLWFEPTILVLDELVNRNEMNLTNAEHGELFNRLGITETNIIENSVIASGSVRDMLEVLNQFRTIDIEENYNFVVQYFADYILSHPEKIQTLGNVERALWNLRETGYIIALVTNDSRLPAEAVLKVAGIGELFDFVGTTDEFPSKPATDSLYAIQSKFGVSFDEMIYIGDSTVDEEFAKNTAGFIAVTSEPNNLEVLPSAIFKVKSIDELS
ncbi:HAD family hydrolase [Granulicatella sp. 20925_1_28]|uniref:HAD family hydrolase n=1 Tax=Granulicatella sp. 20925_1_28 TaxID=3003686 RepID=UPI00352FDBED